MSLLEIKDGISEYSKPLLNKNKENPFNQLLNVVILKVFSFFDPPSFKASSCVCRHWKLLASQLTVSIPLTIQPDLFNQNCFKLSIGTIANAGEIADIVVTAFSKGDIFRKVGQKRTSPEEVIEDMQAPNNSWYIVTVRTKIVAAMLYISDSETDASIHMLSSHPNYWGQKLGTVLIRKAENVAKQQGRIRLNLSAAQTNMRLIKYYEKLGFKKTKDCKEEEYFSPELQKAYLVPQYQGYQKDGKAKLRNYDMTMTLEQPRARL